ncbi:hypothetical protein E2E27_15240 [Porphyrobacter sp. YT40]|nr:hypothetical protein [Porphyrobacter sp. YT40]QDH35547.1 hypothetical protein E2E27_15240 [Porphyrobacter sp. YT40]
MTFEFIDLLLIGPHNRSAIGFDKPIHDLSELALNLPDLDAHLSDTLAASIGALFPEVLEYLICESKEGRCRRESLHHIVQRIFDPSTRNGLLLARAATLAAHIVRIEGVPSL